MYYLFFSYRNKNNQKKISSTDNFSFIYKDLMLFYLFILFFLLLFVFHRVVSMGGCSLALSMVLYLTETLYFRSSELTFYVTFPCVLNCKLKNKLKKIPVLLFCLNKGMRPEYINICHFCNPDIINY